MNILVVDDEEIILSLTTKILKRQGYDVLTADSGEEALRLCDQPSEPIDLMLLDLIMPGLSGVETLRRAREIKPDLPCIISSGQDADWDDIPEDIKVYLHFLRKPYRADKLTELVDGILPKPTS